MNQKNEMNQVIEENFDRVIVQSNEVNISFFDERGKPINTEKWNVSFGKVVADEKQLNNDYAQNIINSYAYSYDNNIKPTNQVKITVKCGRNKDKATAKKFVNEGYGTNILVNNDEWPKKEDIIVNNPNFNRNAAMMNVHGDYAIPEEMNFFVPCCITTDMGMEINLVLGQSSDKEGFKSHFGDYLEAYSYWARMGIDIYNENPFKFAKHATKFVSTVIKIAKFNNPWYIIAVGDTENPAAINDGNKGLLFMGKQRNKETNGAFSSYNGYSQAGIFYIDDKRKNESFDFTLRLMDAKKM